MLKIHTPLLTAIAMILSAAHASAADNDLAQQGYSLLKKYCYRCHGIDFKVPGMNVLDLDSLTAARKDAKPYLVVGKPDDSVLWERVGLNADMPPEDAPEKPSDAERELLKKWILGGSPFPGREARPFQSERQIVESIHAHLSKSRATDRPFLRYFTLTNLFNDYQNVTNDEMRLYRAALSKLINSLSFRPSIVVPQAVDAEQTIFAIDLRDIGWDKNDLWKEVLKAYPYGLKHDRNRNVDFAQLASDVYRMTGSELPYLRADWFISTASRPPLYHTLLELPENAKDLETKLSVDVESDFLRGRLARAGFATSGVSAQNRLVDRHDAIHGFYWKSYDFKTNEGDGNLFVKPLGPKFANNPFNNQAFESDGGEMIFTLPNGLQGYFLTDGKGARIDSGPVEVVSDALKTSGTPAIVTGLSCMACHKHGMIRFKDTLSDGSAVAGNARLKLDELIPPPDKWDALLSKDEDRFLTALKIATGPFLQVGDDAGKDIRAFPEPVSAIAMLYSKDVTVEQAAFELGLADPAPLKNLISANTDLRGLGLAPLARGEKIKRETWHSTRSLLSQFHRVATQLEAGVPHVQF
jgi:serine/threonine-protein kinase